MRMNIDDSEREGEMRVQNAGELKSLLRGVALQRGVETQKRPGDFGLINASHEELRAGELQAQQSHCKM